MKVRNVEKKIFAEHRNLSGTSESDSKYKYVKLARGLPTFGVHFFLVKVGEHDFNLRHCPRNRLFLNPSLSPSWPFYCKFLLVQCSESLCPVKRLKTFEFNNKMTQKSIQENISVVFPSPALSISWVDFSAHLVITLVIPNYRICDNRT